MSILKGSEDDGYNAPFLGADLELDGSRRREISLYRRNELVLTVERNVTLGFVKLCYSSDPKFTGILQGVQSRSTPNQSPVTSVLLSDERVLDQDEYELIILDHSDHSAMLQDNIATPLSTSSAGISLTSQNNNTNILPLSTPQLSVGLPNDTDKKRGNFVCEYCHLPFVSKAKFLRHRRIHTEEKPYECVHCHESFSHHAELRNHRNEQHMTNKSFKCSFCPKTFAARAELKGHLWRHTGEKNEKCRICGKDFATKGNLKLHLDKHIGVHKHKCPFCPQNFTSHSSLEAHMAKHTGMKAYKCRHCPKSYAQAGQLTSHERVHTGEKPFLCQVCGKEFRLNSTRLAHEKRHSGTRPHICDTCGRSFSMADHLRRHLKTHVDKLDRLVACPFCKKKIFSGRNMRKHLLRHKDLNLTDNQAKAIAASLKPDRDTNERDILEEDQRSSITSQNVRQIIRCVECGQEVKSVRKLFEHLSSAHFHRELTSIERKEMRLRHGLQKLHHCPFCTSYFLDYRLLRSHVLSEHARRADEIGFINKNNEANNANATHRCPNCSMCFHLRGALDQHIFKEHLTTVIESVKEDAIPQFRCWYCRLSFPSPEEVVNHMTNQHETLDVLSKRVEMTSENDVTTSGLWTCSHCPVNLKSHEEYLNHLEFHSVNDSSTMKSTAKITSSDEANKYLNPMQIGIRTSESLADKFMTINDSLTTVSSRGKDFNIQHQSCPQNSGLAVLGSASEDEVYLTTSSLSATSADINMASSDLTQVDFISIASKGDRVNAKFDEKKHDEKHTNLNENNLVIKDASSTSTNAIEEIPSYEHGLKEDLKLKLLTKKMSKPPSHFEKENRIENNLTSTELRHDDEIHTSSVVPFKCWFCPNIFACPEEVVAHMTTEHDNLDNLSRRIETTDDKLANNDRFTTKLKHLKRSSDASLSPIEGQACPKCSKKLESKEAYELHMMVHNAFDNVENPSGTLSLSRQKSADRVPFSNNLDVVSLPEEIDENSTTTFSVNYSATISKFSSKSVSNSLKLSNNANTNKDSRKQSSTQKNRRRKKGSSSAITKKESSKSSTTIVVEGNNNVNKCIHCSRIFCGRKALYVHTLKMHGKEYLKKRKSQVKKSPFACWFCSANFKSPELVVEHMTNAHENLDKLSKRIESQDIPLSMNGCIPQKIPDTPTQKFVPIAPHKQIIPASLLRSSATIPNPNTSQSENHQQPPPGFKVSYALAYVPVFVPADRPDNSELDKDEDAEK